MRIAYKNSDLDIFYVEGTFASELEFLNEIVRVNGGSLADYSCIDVDNLQIKLYRENDIVKVKYITEYELLLEKLSDIETIRISFNEDNERAINFIQNDLNTRFIRVHINEEYSLDDVTIIKAIFIKPDKTYSYIDVDKPINSKDIIVPIPSGVLAVKGIVEFNLALYGENKKLTTGKMRINVKKNLGETEILSSNEWIGLDQTLAKLEAWNEEFEGKSGQLETLYTTELNKKINNEIFEEYKVSTEEFKVKTTEQLDKIKTEKADKTDLNVLKNRMDSFTSLPQGSTTGDAELIDGRVAANGKVYSTIGNAIREQIKNTSEIVKTHKEINDKAIGVTDACEGIVTLKSTVKNIFKLDLNTTKANNASSGSWSSNNYTLDGLTYTIDEETNIVTVNGTATKDTGLNLYPKEEIAIGEPIAYSGCPSGGSADTYQLRGYVKRDGSNIVLGNDYGSGYVCWGNLTQLLRLIISIKSGVVCNNLKFKLMANEGNLIQPYVPYNYNLNVYGGNIFDYTKLKKYVNIDASNGNLNEWKNYIGTKDYIPFWGNIDFTVSILEDGTTSKNSNLTIAYYDENKNYISGGNYNSIHQHSPKECRYIRFSYYHGDFTIIENLTIAFGHLESYKLYPYKAPTTIEAKDGNYFENSSESFNLVTDYYGVKFTIDYPNAKFIDLINKNSEEIESIKLDIEEIKNKESNDSIPATFISKEKELIWGKKNIQDLTFVGEELWGITASNDSHTDYAIIHRWDIDTMTEKPSLTHNLGHGASLDYNVETNCLMVGNGTTPTNILPRMDIIHNANTLCGDTTHQLTLGDDNIVSIDFSSIGGSGLCCCWGESKAIAYLFVMTSDGKRHIHKVKLGMGSNDYSDSTGQDSRKFGTFIAGKSANEYNGTAYLLSSHTGVDTWTFQGCCYHDGYLHLATGGHIARILKIQCLTNGTYDIVESYEIEDYYADQNRVNFEPEGACVYRGIYMVTYVGNMNTEYEDKVCMLPMYNKQAGKGTIGTRVNLPFKCNMKPLVQITPTSNVTDLYISSIDNTGFTVSSSIGGSGTFNWECPIS